MQQETTSPEIADVRAIKEALSWIKMQNWPLVEVESDCYVMVQAVKSKVLMVSPFGYIIKECRSMFRELNTVSLFFIKPYDNMAVHLLQRGIFFSGSSF